MVRILHVRAPNNKKAQRKTAAAPKKKKQQQKEKLFIVERFCTARTDPVTKRLQVLVKWKHYGDQHSSWEPIEELRKDGLKQELDALLKPTKATMGARRPYLFVVRFGNVAKGPGIYKRLATFLHRFKAVKYHLRVPGNIHMIIDLTPAEAIEFTSEFRKLLKSAAPVTCTHAQLWPIMSETATSMLSVYPPLM